MYTHFVGGGGGCGTNQKYDPMYRRKGLHIEDKALLKRKSWPPHKEILLYIFQWGVGGGWRLPTLALPPLQCPCTCLYIVAIALSTIAITHLYIISIQIAIMSIVKPCLHITMK